MLNSFKSIRRSLTKNKSFSAISILGLTIGISTSLVIYLIVSFDLAFDQFEKDGDRIYRIVSEMKFSGQPYYNPGVPEPLAPAVVSEVQGVEMTVPFLQPNFDVKVGVSGPGAGVAAAGQAVVFKKQPGILFAGESYFDLLSYQWLAGNPRQASAHPLQVVLTESRAKLYFPMLRPEEAIGKVITYNDSIPLVVAGVVKDLHQQTDLSFVEFVSLPSVRSAAFKDSYSPDWNSTNGTSQLFIKLDRSRSAAQVERQLSVLLQKYRKDQKQDGQNSYILRLQPLSDIHFNSNYGTFVQWDSGDRAGTVSKTVLYGLLAAGVLLLLLACVNFINLATALATQRAKEVGIRKTLGSSKQQLRIQFMAETLVITVFASGLSLALAPLLLKALTGIIPSGVKLDLIAQPGIFLFLALLVIVVTGLAGFYPAIVLSRYNPIEVLKNRPSGDGSSRKTRMRKSLTLAQFTVAQAFIMGALVVSTQIHFLLKSDIGYKKDAVIYFYVNGGPIDNNRRLVLQERMENIPDVAMVSLSNDPPTSKNSWNGPWSYSNGKNSIKTQAEMKIGDTGFIRLYGMRLLAGQNFVPSDTLKDVLINETYARSLGFATPQEAVGKWLYRKEKRVPIAGVVADFHVSSLHERIKPLVIYSRYADEFCMNVRLSAVGAAGWQGAIGKIAEEFKKVYPEQDIDYHFLDDTIAQFYKGEQDIAVLLNWATGLAIVISCMGLLGLVIYSTNSRTKEIGVRKILGASVGDVVGLLSVDFIKLVSIAFLIAMPLAWWGAHLWLSGFPYRTGIGWWTFVLTGAGMLLLALLTLSVQVIRAALANPVKSLRAE